MKSCETCSNSHKVCTTFKAGFTYLFCLFNPPVRTKQEFFEEHCGLAREDAVMEILIPFWGYPEVSKPTAICKQYKEKTE